MSKDTKVMLLVNVLGFVFLALMLISVGARLGNTMKVARNAEVVVKTPMVTEIPSASPSSVPVLKPAVVPEPTTVPTGN